MALAAKITSPRFELVENVESIVLCENGNIPQSSNTGASVTFDGLGCLDGHGFDCSPAGDLSDGGRDEKIKDPYAPSTVYVNGRDIPYSDWTSSKKWEKEMFRKSYFENEMNILKKKNALTVGEIEILPSKQKLTPSPKVIYSSWAKQSYDDILSDCESLPPPQNSPVSNTGTETSVSAGGPSPVFKRDLRASARRRLNKARRKLFASTPYCNGTDSDDSFDESFPPLVLEGSLLQVTERQVPNIYGLNRFIVQKKKPIVDPEVESVLSFDKKGKLIEFPNKIPLVEDLKETLGLTAGVELSRSSNLFATQDFLRLQRREPHIWVSSFTEDLREKLEKMCLKKVFFFKARVRKLSPLECFYLKENQFKSSKTWSSARHHYYDAKTLAEAASLQTLAGISNGIMPLLPPPAQLLTYTSATILSFLSGFKAATPKPNGWFDLDIRGLAVSYIKDTIWALVDDAKQSFDDWLVNHQTLINVVVVSLLGFVIAAGVSMLVLSWSDVISVCKTVLGVFYDGFDKVWEFVKSIIPKKEDDRILANSDVPIEAPWVIGAFGLISTLGYRNIIKPHQYASLLSSIPRIGTGMSQVGSSLVECMKNTINWVTKTLGGSQPFKVSTAVVDIDKFVASVEGLILHPEKRFDTIKDANQLLALVQTSNELLLKYGGDARLSKVISNCTVLLRPYIDRCEEAKVVTSGIRQEPVVVMLTGMPGVGKSWVLEPIIAAFLKTAMPDLYKEYLKDPSRVAYSRNILDNFWSNYTLYHAICKWDDAFQKRETVNSTVSEFLEIIRAANREAVNLNQGALHQKGTSFFRSSLCLLTTNMQNLESQTIHSIEAFKRRIDVNVRVQGTPESGYVVKGDNGHERWIWHPDADMSLENLRFLPLDPNGKVKGAAINFAQLMSWILETYEKKYVAFLRAPSLVDEAIRMCRPVATEFATANGKFDVDIEAPPQLSDPITAIGLPPDKASKLRTYIAFTAFAGKTEKIAKYLEEKDSDEVSNLQHVREALLKNSITNTTVYEAIIKDMYDFFPEEPTIMLADTKKEWTSFTESVKSTVEEHKRVFKWLGLVSGIVGFFGVVYKLMNLTDSNKVSPNYVQETRAPGASRPPPPVYTNGKFEDLVFTNRDTSVSDQIQKIMKNVVRLIDKNGFAANHMLIMRRGMAVAIKHTISGLFEGCSYRDERNNVIEINKGDVRIFDAGIDDLVYVVCDKFNGRDITSLVNTQKFELSAKIPVVVARAKENETSIVETHTSAYPITSCEYGTENKKFSMLMVGGWAAHVPGYSGACGSVLISAMPTTQSRLLGIAAAGSSNKAYYYDLSKLSFAHVEQKPEVSYALFVQWRSSRDYVPVPILANGIGDFPVVCDVEEESYYPKKTTISQSIFHGFRPVQKFPARLKPFTNEDGVLIVPFDEAVNKRTFKFKTVDYTDEAVIDAVQMFFDWQASRSSSYSWRMLTFEEAVFGSREYYNYKGIDMGKSPGLPWVLHGYGSTGSVFGNPLEPDLLCPSAMHLREIVEDVFKSGVVPVWHETFRLFLKDEPVSQKKVDSGSTRLIFGGPLAQRIVLSMIFGPYLHWVTQNRVLNASAAGMDPVKEWDLLCSLMGGLESEVCFADHSGYDITTNSMIAKHLAAGFLNYRTNLSITEPVYPVVVSWLCQTLVHIGKQIVRMENILASGRLDTNMFGSAYNGIGNILADAHMTSKRRPICRIELPHFLQKTPAIFCSDDMLFKGYKGFDAARWVKGWNALGHTITDGSKEGEVRLMPLKHGEFLKMQFGELEYGYRRIVPKLAIKSIETMVQWVKVKKNKEEVTRTNVDTALLWISLHGKKEHSLFVNDLKRFVKERGIVFHSKFMDWEFTAARALSGIPLAIVQEGPQQAGEQNDLMVVGEGDDEWGIYSYSPGTQGTGSPNPGAQNAALDGSAHGALVDSMFNIRPGANSYISDGDRIIPNGMSSQQNMFYGNDHESDLLRELIDMTSIYPNGNEDDEQQPGSKAVELGESITCTTGYDENQLSTTKFSNDGCIEELVVKTSTKMPVNVGEDEMPDIIRFLEKPIAISTGNISTATAVGVVSTLNLPDALFTNAIYADKLQGVFGWRGDIKIDLVVNAHRMQQGQLRVFRWPIPYYNSERFAMQTSNRVLWSQLPGITIDVGTETKVSMIVPWTHFQPFYQLHKPTTASDPYAKIPFASISIAVLSELYSPSGLANYEYQIFASCVNNELFHAAPGDAYYAANGKLDSELPSKMMSKLTTSLRSARNVPVLGPLMEQASWVSDTVSGALRTVGLSAPRQLDPITKMYPQIHNYTSSDEASVSANLGVFKDARTHMPGGVAPTDLDEMSIQHICSKYTVVNEMTWDTSNATGVSLGNVAAEPYSQNVAYTLNSASLVGFATIGYLARGFKFWRGGIKFRLRFVATEFHSGRLSIVSVPGAFAPTSAPNYTTDMPYLQRTIVDLATSRVFEFTVPFTFAAGWAPVGTRCATLFFTVQNQLRAPDTVNSGIRILIEVCGGEDFQLAVPVATNLPVLKANGDALGSVQDVERDVSTTAMTIGESITSLRSLLKRYEHYVSMAPPTAGLFGSLPIDGILMKRTAAGTDNFNYTNFWSMIGAMFAMNRGGIRIRMITNSTTAPVTFDWPQPSLTNSFSNSVSGSTSDLRSIAVASNASVSNILDVECPFYSNYPALPNLYFARSASTGALTVNTVTAGITSPNRYPALWCQFNPAATDFVTFLRGAAEDFTFTCFVGCPPITTNTVAITSAMPWAGTIL